MRSLIGAIIVPYLDVMQKMPRSMGDSLCMLFLILVFETFLNTWYAAWNGTLSWWSLARILLCWKLQTMLVSGFAALYQSFRELHGSVHCMFERMNQMAYVLHASGANTRVPTAIVSVPWTKVSCPICLELLEPSVSHVIAVADDCPNHHVMCAMSATQGGCHATCWAMQKRNKAEANCPICRKDVEKLVYCR